MHENRLRPSGMKRIVCLSLVLGVLLFPFLDALAQALELHLPVDCHPGQDCFVQNYPDRDPGPGAADYRCGPLTYDGHTGTDIRVHQKRMRQGVTVRAAADGVVRATRDGMPDISVKDAGRESVDRREAGNAVVLDHGDGFITLYAHLRQGSVLVKPGQKVKAGQPLGMVGLSGMTVFPHLHFEVRRDNHPICPFAGADAPAGCTGAGTSLWDATSRQELGYLPSIAWSAGFAASPPALDAAQRDMAQATSLPAASPSVIFWAIFLGPRQGDHLHLRLTGPDGSVLAENDALMDRSLAQKLQFVGRRRTAVAWPPGVYTGTAAIVHPGQEQSPTATIQATVTIR